MLGSYLIPNPLKCSNCHRDIEFRKGLIMKVCYCGEINEFEFNIVISLVGVENGN